MAQRVKADDGSAAPCEMPCEREARDAGSDDCDRRAPSPVSLRSSVS